MILRDGYMHGRHLGEHRCGTCLNPVYVVRIERPTTERVRWRTTMLDTQPGTERDHEWVLDDLAEWKATRNTSHRHRHRFHCCAATTKAVTHLNNRRIRQQPAA